MGKVNDLTNQTFGYLTVIRDSGKRTKSRNVIWTCLCKCGKICEIPGNYLQRGSTRSCGCFREEHNYKDITGKKFGKLTVLELTEETKNSYKVWKCKCDCGNICYKSSWALNNGHVNSCGCLTSKGEALIKNLLDQNNISYKQQYTFSDLISDNGGNLRFDFAIFDNCNKLKKLIEYQGEQHFYCSEDWWNTKEHFEIVKNNDNKKKEYCEKHNIEIVYIPYTDYNNITIERLI